jgi:hypothetical protein
MQAGEAITHGEGAAGLAPPQAMGDEDAGDGQRCADGHADEGLGGGRLQLVVEARVVERRMQEVVEDVGHRRDLQDAADHRQHRQRAHGGLHRPLPLGDVVLGTGEAHFGVLELA